MTFGVFFFAIFFFKIVDLKRSSRTVIPKIQLGFHWNFFHADNSYKLSTKFFHSSFLPKIRGLHRRAHEKIRGLSEALCGPRPNARAARGFDHENGINRGGFPHWRQPNPTPTLSDGHRHRHGDRRRRRRVLLAPPLPPRRLLLLLLAAPPPRGASSPPRLLRRRRPPQAQPQAAQVRLPAPVHGTLSLSLSIRCSSPSRLTPVC